MIAQGSQCYARGASPCIGAGRTWSDEELDAAISGPVAEVVFDDEGAADIAAILASVAETEFEQTELARVLADPDDIEDWRVGEAIAETWLSAHRNCSFPWPDGRDERKSGSSLPGADLVGFQADDEGHRFAFGEVKTSAENKYPPQAMYGRTGLKQQLEDLRDQVKIRRDLVKYLGHRAGTASWRPRYLAASKRYLANVSDVQLYGVLIRDVEPHEDDVRVRVDKLAADCPQGTAIELLAIYLPAGSIAHLAAKTLAKREGGSA